jgi:hypothetical protein
VTERFALRIERRWRVLLLLWAVTPSRAWVEVDDRELRARYGWWKLSTPLSNIASYSTSGPYRWWRAIGLRQSIPDLGLTFGTSTHGGVTVLFREKVRLFLVGHPDLTVTVDDLEGLARALAGRGVPRAG